MKIDVNVQLEVKEKSSKVKELLDKIAEQTEEVSGQQISDLEYYAASLSKLAYGNNLPELLNNETYNLIAWCDHTHENKILSLFSEALKSRPLVQPQWVGGN